MGCACSKHAGVQRGASSHPKAAPTSNSPLVISVNGCQATLAAGPLSPEQFKQRLTTSGTANQVITVPGSGFTLRYALASLRGYYPAEPNKPNQDTWVVRPQLEGRPQQHLFGVLDGHGEQGTEVAQFAGQQVPAYLEGHPDLATYPAAAFKDAMTATNLDSHRSSTFDDTMSGTTAVVALLQGSQLLVANVGDSRAVLGVQEAPAPLYPGGSYTSSNPGSRSSGEYYRRSRKASQRARRVSNAFHGPLFAAPSTALSTGAANGSSSAAATGKGGAAVRGGLSSHAMYQGVELKLQQPQQQQQQQQQSLLLPGPPMGALDMSLDQTAFRADECARVRAAGATVRTLQQLLGAKIPGGMRPRMGMIHLACGCLSGPGTAFTRSIGDAVAERLGVCAEPEIITRDLGPSDAFLVLASDGVFEFLSSQQVVDLVAPLMADPQQAALTLVTTAYNHWITQDVRSDDITCVVIAFDWSTPVVDTMHWGGGWASGAGHQTSHSSGSGQMSAGNNMTSDGYRPRKRLDTCGMSKARLTGHSSTGLAGDPWMCLDCVEQLPVQEGEEEEVQIIVPRQLLVRFQQEEEGRDSSLEQQGPRHEVWLQRSHATAGKATTRGGQQLQQHLQQQQRDKEEEYANPTGGRLAAPNAAAVSMRPRQTTLEELLKQHEPQDDAAFAAAAVSNQDAVAPTPAAARALLQQQQQLQETVHNGQQQQQQQQQQQDNWQVTDCLAAARLDLQRQQEEVEAFLRQLQQDQQRLQAARAGAVGQGPTPAATAEAGGGPVLPGLTPVAGPAAAAGAAAAAAGAAVAAAATGAAGAAAAGGRSAGTAAATLVAGPALCSSSTSSISSSSKPGPLATAVPPARVLAGGQEGTAAGARGTAATAGADEVQRQQQDRAVGSFQELAARQQALLATTSSSRSSVDVTDLRPVCNVPSTAGWRKQQQHGGLLSTASLPLSRVGSFTVHPLQQQHHQQVLLRQQSLPAQLTRVDSAPKGVLTHTWGSSRAADRPDELEVQRVLSDMAARAQAVPRLQGAGRPLQEQYAERQQRQGQGEEQQQQQRRQGQGEEQLWVEASGVAVNAGSWSDPVPPVSGSRRLVSPGAGDAGVTACGSGDAGAWGLTVAAAEAAAAAGRGGDAGRCPGPPWLSPSSSCNLQVIHTAAVSPAGVTPVSLSPVPQAGLATHWVDRQGAGSAGGHGNARSMGVSPVQVTPGDTSTPQPLLTPGATVQDAGMAGAPSSNWSQQQPWTMAAPAAAPVQMSGHTTPTWSNPALGRSPSSSRSGSPLRNMSGSPLLGQLLRVKSWSGSKQGGFGLSGKNTPGCHSGSAPVTRQNSGGLKELVDSGNAGTTGDTGTAGTVNQQSEGALRQKEIEEAVLQAVLAALRPEVVAAARGHTKAVQQVKETLTAQQVDRTAVLPECDSTGAATCVTPVQAGQYQQVAGARGSDRPQAFTGSNSSNSSSSIRPPWINNPDAAAAVHRGLASKEPSSSLKSHLDSTTRNTLGGLGSGSSSSNSYPNWTGQAAAQVAGAPAAAGQQRRQDQLLRSSRESQSSTSSSSSSIKSSSSASSRRPLHNHRGSTTQRKLGPAVSGNKGAADKPYLGKMPSAAAAAGSLLQSGRSGGKVQLHSLTSNATTTSSSKPHGSKQAPVTSSTRSAASHQGTGGRKAAGTTPDLPVFNSAVHGSYEAFLDVVLGCATPPPSH